ncbi:MAG: class I SAM-dependent methyltransferase [Pseudomonadota bacterium]|nr:MAG: class I SAM-dependent methyltransferase [Pseudomonadota bacterium]
MESGNACRLTDQARRALADPRLAAALLDHCRWMPGDLAPAALDTAVHPDCQMLGHSLKAHQDAALAVSQYFAVALQQYHTVRQLAERLFATPRRIEFLDFACGYGRLLRFLVHSLSPAQISAAEIQPEAVRWVRERYGVTALQSSAEPEAFDCPRRFDMIWAASLFSHLPHGLFQRWLAQLIRLLEPSGALCFSVHGEALLPGNQSMPDNGIRYLDTSENPELGAEIYGTTFVTEAYVSRAIRAAAGAGCGITRLPKLLAHEQDVYVVTMTGAKKDAGLATFERGTRGWLDQLQIDREHNIVNLRGWAGSLDATPFGYVETCLGNRCRRHAADQPRPDVARVLDCPGLTDSGFSISLPLPDSGSDHYLTISAVNAASERSLIYAGDLAGKVCAGTD